MENRLSVFQPQGEAARIRKDRPVYDSCRQFEKVGGNHGAGNCRLHDIHHPGLSHGIVIQNKPFCVCGAFHHMRRYHLSRPSAQADKGSEIIRRIDRIRLEMVDVVLRRTILKHQYRVLNQLYGIATHDFWQGKTRRSGKRNGLVRTHIFQPYTVNHPTLATGNRKEDHGKKKSTSHTMSFFSSDKMLRYPSRNNRNSYNLDIISYNIFLTYLSLSTSDRNLRFRTSPTLRHWQRTIHLPFFTKTQQPTLSEPTPRAMRSDSS